MWALRGKSSTKKKKRRSKYIYFGGGHANLRKEKDLLAEKKDAVSSTKPGGKGGKDLARKKAHSGRSED